MNIVINTGLSFTPHKKDKEYFLKEVFGQIITAHPHHHFIVIYDIPSKKDLLQGENITAVYAGKMAANRLLWKWWYDVKLPLLLKKYKADVFVDMNSICSSTAKIPQCILYSEALLSVKNNFLPRFLNKAKSIITLSSDTADNIQNSFKVKADKISVIYPAGRNIFYPVSEQEQSDVKNKYTEDQNYFISGPVHSMGSFINLLKAFSVFKKRQKSSWRLVFAEMEIDYSEKLKTYKYREDILVVKNTKHDELIKLVGSSYAMIYLQETENFILPPLEAMACDVPVIVPSSALMKELYGDTVLYTDATDPNDIADKMMRLYKDEILRNDLIKKGNEAATKYSWSNTADLFWQSILKAVP